MKKNIIYLLILVFTISSVSAALLYNASDIEFTPVNAEWNVKNVEEALNNLKSENDKYKVKGDFDITISDIKTDSVKVTVTNNVEDFSYFSYKVSDSSFGGSNKNEFVVGGLTEKTNYILTVSAITTDGKILSHDYNFRTSDILYFTTDYLKTGSLYLNASVVDNLYNGYSGLSLTGASTNSTQNINSRNTQPRWVKTIDLTRYDKLTFYAKKGAVHGNIDVYIDDTCVLKKYYSILDTSWNDYIIDVSKYSGNHTLYFIGGYDDKSGNTSSNTQYANIRLS